MSKERLPELNLETRELEWARLRYWAHRHLEESKDPPLGDPDSPEFIRRLRVRANIEATRGLDDDLKAAGIPVPFSVLRGAKVPYPAAIPVLLRHLQLPYNDDVKWSIIAALAVPYAGATAFDTLYAALLAETSCSDSILFAYGVALATMASKAQTPKLLSIARERRLGDARHMVIIRLAKWKVTDAIQIARDFLDDEHGECLALKALRLLRSWEDKTAAQSRLESTNADVRAEAKKFLKALDKAAARQSSP